MYNKTNWIDHIEDPSTGEVIQQGTRFTAQKMNHIEEGIEEAHKGITNTATKEYVDQQDQAMAKQINDCLVPATKDKLGMVKVGDNLTITKEGKLNGAAPYTHPNDTNTRHVTDAQINTWNNKASAHDHPYIPTSASCNKNWNWDGQGGQPTWLWGGNDPSNMFVYNPANFNVNYANSAANANALGGLTLQQILAKAGDFVGKELIALNAKIPLGTTYTYNNSRGGLARIITGNWIENTLIVDGNIIINNLKIANSWPQISDGDGRSIYEIYIPFLTTFSIKSSGNYSSVDDINITLNIYLNK